MSRRDGGAQAKDRKVNERGSIADVDEISKKRRISALNFMADLENLRHLMIEALITSFPVHAIEPAAVESEQMAFFEKPLAEYSSKGL